MFNCKQKKNDIHIPQSIEVLDMIFSEIAKTPMNDGVMVTPESLQNFLSNTKQLRYTNKQLFSLLDKLQTDGMIVAKDHQDNRRLETISYKTPIEITFAGILFRDTIKSYRSKYLIELAESKRLEALEISQRANENHVIGLTIVIAAGTTIAAIYYAIEVMKYLKWIHS